jgi:peptidoglycan LD-endopeptidase LytH
MFLNKFKLRVKALKLNYFVVMTIKRVVGIVMVLFVSAWTTTNHDWEKDTTQSKILRYCADFNRIQMDIRDCNISPDSASRAFKENIENIRNVFGVKDCQPLDTNYFVFPVRGYLPRVSIGGRGRGYRPDGYDMFDMDVRGSHPAHDIFIHDKNKDQMDDRTNEPVDILSFSSGIVLASEKNWQYDTDRRGGNWVWVYDPCLDGLFYYAHNRRVVVDPGQWVNAGQKIAEMGRTGFSANKTRSPTHLHFMYLKVNSDGLPEPNNTYEWLINAINQ